MRLLRNLCFLTLAFAVASVCSAQDNQDPIRRDKVLMHNAMIKGDTQTMEILLDKGSVKLDGWVGFGNIQTWVEDACWSASPVAFEYLLQRGADTLRADTVNPSFPKINPSNALYWCVGRGVRRGGPDSAEVFRIFIEYFEQQVKKTTDPRKTLNEQVAMAGGTGRLISSAVGNNDDSCLEKVTWVVKSGQDITELERQDDWQTLLANRSKSNPTCVAYLRNELGLVAQSAESSSPSSDNSQAGQTPATPSAPGTGGALDHCVFSTPETQAKVSPGKVSGGKLIHRVQPEYPPAARKAHIQGTVVLCATIDKDGKLRNVRAFSGPEELIPSAIKAVEQWRYQPYLKNNEPVDVDSEIRLGFKLGP